MIGTEVTHGDGLGNQLFRYVTARCIALDRGEEFGILGKETFANNMHSSCGLYFMNLDFGKEVKREEKANYPWEVRLALLEPINENSLIPLLRQSGIHGFRLVKD